MTPASLLAAYHLSTPEYGGCQVPSDRALAAVELIERISRVRGPWVSRKCFVIRLARRLEVMN